LSETTGHAQPDPSNLAPTQSRAVGSLIAIAEALFLTLVIYFVLQTFVVQPFRVFQESMFPTFHPGDYVLVDKLTPRFDGYSRGDVVVFNPVARETCSGPVLSEEGSEPFIKRVMGEPNDEVELRHGAVWINGHQVDEPYVHGQRTDPSLDTATWIVPADRLFVMGDNRGDSTDSRAFGPICQVDVVGRAWLRYWPLDQFGIIGAPQYQEVPLTAATP
jgi:signal peptidase I